MVLPKLTEDLCRVHILKIRKSEAIDDLEPLNHVAGALQIQEVRLKEDRMFNDIAVLDMQDITWSYLKKMTPTFLLKCATIYEVEIQKINSFTNLIIVENLFKSTQSYLYYQQFFINRSSFDNFEKNLQT